MNERRALRLVVPQSSVSTSLYRSAKHIKPLSQITFSRRVHNSRTRTITTIHNTTQRFTRTSSSLNVNKEGCQSKKKTAFKKKPLCWTVFKLSGRYARYRITGLVYCELRPSLYSIHWFYKQNNDINF